MQLRLVFGTLLLMAAPPLAAQSPLTLREAFRRADAAAYGNRIASGNARAQRAQATAALQGIVPAIRVEGGFTRTNNPMGAFGLTLQQRGVSAASFSPVTLNSPLPVDNWSAGLVAEVPLLNVDAWFGRAAAANAAAAAEAGAGWTREATRVDVVRAYFGAVLAREQLNTLEAAIAAGRAHQRQAESMVANGAATRSDALLAAVQVGQLEAQLIGARGNAGIARAQLALLLGQPGDTSLALPDSLPCSTDILDLAAQPVAAVASRLDVTAARLAFDAAQGDVRRANARYLPRVNGIGRYDWNRSDGLFAGPSSYTIGVMASWSPFAGASDIAGRQAALGRADAARAGAEAAEASAAVDRSAAETQLQVAIARLGIAERAVKQVREAHRIVERKYAGGLATIAELLSAAALETQTGLGFSEARYQTILAAAQARRATGADVLALAALEH